MFLKIKCWRVQRQRPVLRSGDPCSHQAPGSLPPHRLLEPPTHSPPSTRGHPAHNRPGEVGFEVLGELGAEAQQSEQRHPREIRETGQIVPKGGGCRCPCAGRVCGHRGESQRQAQAPAPCLHLFSVGQGGPDRSSALPPRTVTCCPLPVASFVTWGNNRAKCLGCGEGAARPRPVPGSCFRTPPLAVSLLIVIVNNNTAAA